MIRVSGQAIPNLKSGADYRIVDDFQNVIPVLKEKTKIK